MEILLCGQRYVTSAPTLAALRSECHIAPDAVAILDGYQSDGDLPLHPGCEVFFLQRGALPAPDELARMMAARLSPGVWERVQKARVGIAGLGGLGSHVAVALARTGIGHLHLVDFDTVEPSNLNRQYYTVRHLGQKKTEALAKQLAEINPYLHIVTDTVRVTAQNAPALFSSDHVVCEAFDRPEAKAELVTALLTARPNRFVVSASGMAGAASANEIVTRRAASHLILCGDSKSGTRPGCGLMAPRVMTCAGHQANAVLEILLGTIV